MTCVFECFYSREEPSSIIGPKETQGTLFEMREIVTDEEKSKRVMKAIGDKISGEAMAFVYHAYLSCLKNKEIYILNFLYLGFKHGKKIMKMLTDETVSTLNKAVTHLTGEAGLLRGFVRFSDYGGGLVATIEPKNNVLPLIRHHFVSRFPDGCFLIYDKTNSLMLAAVRGKSRIVQVEGFEAPSAGAEEVRYRELWKRFYDTIAVEGRENPKCRMTHMPKRYWANMTEFQSGSDTKMITGEATERLIQ
jgi:probable DNA metabolism protein